MTSFRLTGPMSRRSFFHQGPDSAEHVTGTFAFRGDANAAARASSRFGVDRAASQRAQAFALVTTAASGWLTS